MSVCSLFLARSLPHHDPGCCLTVQAFVFRCRRRLAPFPEGCAAPWSKLLFAGPSGLGRRRRVAFFFRAMSSPRILLYTRLLLILNLVRGKHGVEMVGDVLRSAKFVTLFSKASLDVLCWRSLYRAVLQRLKKSGMTASSISHAEGLHAGYSGLHPLKALAFSAAARINFDEMVAGCYEVVLSCTCPGFVLLPEHVLRLWTAIKGKAPLALRESQLKKAGRYTSMSLTRAMVDVLCETLHCACNSYNDDLHGVMCRGQSRVSADYYNSSVFKLFGISSRKQFLNLWRSCARLMLGMRCISFRMLTSRSITFLTFHVHLCEVKQCLKTFGVAMVRRILKAVRACDDGIRKQLRDAHSALMVKGYVGGSQCHAVFMVRTAARLLHISLQKAGPRRLGGSRSEMHKVLKDMARMQLSPKLSLLCIPEWRSVSATAVSLYAKAVNKFPRDIASMKLAELRARAVAADIPRVRCKDKLELLVLLSKPVETRLRPRLVDLHRLVRERGGNPRCSSKQQLRSWNVDQCRQHLLHKRKVSELRALISPDHKRCRSTKNEMIQLLMKDVTVY